MPLYTLSRNCQKNLMGKLMNSQNVLKFLGVRALSPGPLDALPMHVINTIFKVCLYEVFDSLLVNLEFQIMIAVFRCYINFI